MIPELNVDVPLTVKVPEQFIEDKDKIVPEVILLPEAERPEHVILELNVDVPLTVKLPDKVIEDTKVPLILDILPERVSIVVDNALLNVDTVPDKKVRVPLNVDTEEDKDI